MKKKLELNKKSQPKTTLADDHVCVVDTSDLGSPLPYTLTYISYDDPVFSVKKTEDPRRGKK